MTGMTRHRRARIAAAVWTVAFAAVLGGAAAVRAERAQTVRAARTAGLLAETDAAVYRLAEDAGDGMLAYHRAMTASECAARAGETPAAEAWAAHGDAGRSDVLPESVLPPGAANKAEAAAKRIVGERAVLSRGTVRPGEKLLFTASNAYVLVDARTGEPVEFSLSLAPGEDRLDARSCADAARQFLRESCPSADTEEADARVTFPEPGFAWVRLPGASVRVRRDTGKVVGLVRA